MELHTVKGMWEVIFLRSKKILFVLWGCLQQQLFMVLLWYATVLMSTDSPSVQAFITAYTAGFIMNVIHGISTFIFLWFMLIPMLKKIDRVNIKYGMYVK